MKVLLATLLVVFSLQLVLISALQPNRLDRRQNVGACNNTNDLNVFQQTNATFHGSLQKCAQGCWAAVDCTTDCVVKTIGLSQPCAKCFGDDVYCTAKHCALPCLRPDSDACTQCSITNCMGPLLECAGVPQSSIPS